MGGGGSMVAVGTGIGIVGEVGVGVWVIGAAATEAPAPCGVGGLTGEEGGPVNSGVARGEGEVVLKGVGVTGPASVGKEVRVGAATGGAAVGEACPGAVVGTGTE